MTMSSGNSVRTGLERLVEEGPQTAGLAPGARIGLLAHPASVDRAGRHAVDLLRERAGLEVRVLFAPEHGLLGGAQDMEAVDERADPRSGLPVVSLYGSDERSLRPSPQDLEGLDAVVCDLQDVGSRYYTFAYTLSYVMEAAGVSGVPVVVPDRPNPIGGTRVEGPVLRPAMSSFVGRYPIPVRHGMTVAELARMFRDRFGAGCDLRTVPMEGWRRWMHYDDTGCLWVPPSPNMPHLETAVVYPGGCLLEGTNLSEGRGTTRPFETLGGPWLDGGRLAESLGKRNPPGVTFRETVFRPAFQKHAGHDCGGVFVHVTDRDAFRPFETYLAVLDEARRQDPESFRWRREAYEFVMDRPAIDLLFGREDLREMIERGASEEEIAATWAGEPECFLEERLPYLLYRD
jgi:uncharacterized protein YbbC (DUF1343 family)